MEELDQLTKQFQVMYSTVHKRTKKIIEQIRKIDKELERNGTNIPSKKRKQADDEEDEDDENSKTTNTTSRRCFSPQQSKKKSLFNPSSWEKYTKRSNRGNANNSISLRYNNNLVAAMANSHCRTLPSENPYHTSPLINVSQKEKEDQVQLSALLVAAAAVDRSKTNNSDPTKSEQPSSTPTSSSLQQQQDGVPIQPSQQQEQLTIPSHSDSYVPSMDQQPSIVQQQSPPTTENQNSHQLEPTTQPMDYHNVVQQAPPSLSDPSNFSLPPISSIGDSYT